MRLYLIIRPGSDGALICCRPEDLAPFLKTIPGSVAYTIGTAHPHVPPGLVGEFAAIPRILMDNVHKVDV